MPRSRQTLAACLLGIVIWVPWRLQWSESRQWVIETKAHAIPEALGVGQTLATAATQSATIRVARIGHMEVMPNTKHTAEFAADPRPWQRMSRERAKRTMLITVRK